MDDANFVDSINGIQELLRQSDLQSEEDVKFLDDLAVDIADLYTSISEEDIASQMINDKPSVTEQELESYEKFNDFMSKLVFLLLLLKSIESSPDDASVKELPVLKHLAKNVLERVSETPVFKKYVSNAKMSGGEIPSFGRIVNVIAGLSAVVMIGSGALLVGTGQAESSELVPSIPITIVPPALSTWWNGESTVPDYMTDPQNRISDAGTDVQLFKELNQKNSDLVLQFTQLQQIHLSNAQKFNSALTRLEQLKDNKAAPEIHRRLGKWIHKLKQQQKEIADLEEKLKLLNENIVETKKKIDETKSTILMLPATKESIISNANAQIYADQTEAKSLQDQIESLSGKSIAGLDLDSFAEKLMYNHPEDIVIRTNAKLPNLPPSSPAAPTDVVVTVSQNNFWGNALNQQANTSDYQIAVMTTALSEIGEAGALTTKNIQDPLNNIQSKIKEIFPNDQVVADFFTTLAQHNTTNVLKQNIQDEIQMVASQKKSQEYVNVFLNNKKIAEICGDKFEAWKSRSGETDAKKIKTVEDRLALEQKRAITIAGQLNILLDPETASKFIFGCALNPGDCKTTSFREARRKIVVLQKPLYRIYDAARTALLTTIPLLVLVGVGGILNTAVSGLGKISLFTKTYNIQGNLIEGGPPPLLRVGDAPAPAPALTNGAPAPASAPAPARAPVLAITNAAQQPVEELMADDPIAQAVREAQAQQAANKGGRKRRTFRNRKSKKTKTPRRPTFVY